MGDFLSVYIIVALLIVITIQVVDKYVSTKEHNSEINKLIAGVLAKNTGEFQHAVRTEGKPIESVVVNDEIDMETADDETFDKAIGIKKDK